MKTLQERQEARYEEISLTISATRTGYGTWKVTARIEGDSYSVITHDEDRFESIRHQNEEPRYSLEEMAEWFEEEVGLLY